MKYLVLTLIALLTTVVVAFEESEGMRSMRLGCEKQKIGLGCTNYANFLIKNGREADAEAYFEKACKLGNQDGCEKKKWESNLNPPPEPVVTEEVSVATTPAPAEPVVTEDVPVATTPAPAEPVVTEEVPVTTTPAPAEPVVTEEVPVATTPAPAEPIVTEEFPALPPMEESTPPQVTE